MIDMRQIIGLIFAVFLPALFLLFYGCSASYHINKAIKKGAKIETRIDTVRVYFRDSVIKDGFKEYFYNYRDTIIQNNTVYVPKTRYETKTEYKIIKEQVKQDAKTDRVKLKQDAKTERKEIQAEKKTSWSSVFKFLAVVLGLVALIIILLKTNKKIGL
jgi:predicted membrane channel-forming protein YqfA (hemolysin III family)